MNGVILFIVGFIVTLAIITIADTIIRCQTIRK